MRRIIVPAIAVLLLITAAWWLSTRPHQPLQADASPAPKAAPPPRISNSSEESPVTLLPVATDAIPLHAADTLPADDLSHLEMLFSEYRKNHGGNPVGENDEITAALLGRNDKRLAYLPVQGSFLNDKGQLIDRWGTPYFFHALSGTHMEIHSAGPDRIMGTTDDVVSE